MKRIIGFVFLSIILLQVAGSYAYFIVRLSGIHQEMREQLKDKPDHELTLLVFTHEQFKKAQVDEHEVMVNGKMYDIARVVFKEEKILAYALHDEAEDNLLALLEEMVERSSKDKKSVPVQLIQLISLIFVPVENLFILNHDSQFTHSTAYFEIALSFAAVIDSPPPRA